jgi:hypothetical protein
MFLRKNHKPVDNGAPSKYTYKIHRSFVVTMTSGVIKSSYTILGCTFGGLCKQGTTSFATMIQPQTY